MCVLYMAAQIAKSRQQALTSNTLDFRKKKQYRDVWINLCRRADNINTNNAVICSIHFTKDHYMDDMKSRLLGVESKYNF